MKKILSILLSALVLLTCSIITIYADSLNPNIEISYNESDNTYTVVIPDDDHYATLKPSITVNTDFGTAKVTLNGAEVDSTTTAGAVTFTITDGDLVYIIEQNTSPSYGKSYSVPKTGIN